MTSILVTGANGQVGQELQQLAAKFPQFEFTFTDVDDLDITDLAAVALFFAKENFDYCLNCAAYTAVDKAEENADLAETINVTGAEHLAKACAEHHVRLLHLSTDYVYHNDQNTPFRETDATNPQSVYARTKLEGEQAARAANPQTLVIRTSWVYSSFGHNFVKTMLRLGRERDHLRVVFDQIGTPTYAHDLAEAMLTLVRKIENNEVDAAQWSGIYHYSNEGVTSWYDFAVAIFELENIACAVTPIRSEEYPTAAQRPPFSLLDKAKIRETFGLKIPHWRGSVQACLQKLIAQT